MGGAVVATTDVMAHVEDHKRYARSVAAIFG
jgi:hypothetical protein